MAKKSGALAGDLQSGGGVQSLGPFKATGALRMISLRPEQIHPVVRIAHKLPGGLVIPERIIFDHELVLILEGRGE